jgi:hypothetical protein
LGSNTLGRADPDHQCYKVVAALFERQLRRSGCAAERVNVLYALHKVLRASKQALRSKSRYRKWLGAPGCCCCCCCCHHAPGKLAARRNRQPL